nr:hypothetical protein [Tanacetum cinerariifolium]
MDIRPCDSRNQYLRGPLVHEPILEFFSTFRFGEAILDLDTPGALQFQLGGARLFAAGRKSGALISRGQFVAQLAEHFRLIIEERLRGLTEALGPERQLDAAAEALELLKILLLLMRVIRLFRHPCKKHRHHQLRQDYATKDGHIIRGCARDSWGVRQHELFDVDSGRISFITVNTKEYHSECSGNYHKDNV